MFLYDDSKINIVIIIIISITNAIYDELFVRLILFLAVVLYSLDRLHYISKRKWMVQIWFKYVKILWNDEITEDNPRIRKSRCFRRNAIIFNIFALKHVLILINDTLMRAFYWIKLRTRATNLAKNSLVTTFALRLTLGTYIDRKPSFNPGKFPMFYLHVKLTSRSVLCVLQNKKLDLLCFCLVLFVNSSFC